MSDVSLPSKKTILILQGPPSRFCRDLGDAFVAQGHQCLRINFCAADFLMWFGRPAHNYYGKFKHFAGFLERFVEKHNVTDILYYADRLPYHRVAATVAKARGIRAYTYEFGYLRPDWVTLECNGMSSHSHFPTDPDHILKAGRLLPEPESGNFHSYTFAMEAKHEVFFHLVNYFFRIPFIHYRRDRYYDELIEYLNYIPRLLKTNKRHESANEIIDTLCSRKTRFFLFAMQMQNDYQLRANSPYRLQETALRDVVSSFAAHADDEDELVFKVHPLDNGMEPWQAIIKETADKHNVSSRVHFIEGGDLNKMLEKAAGLVMINSTTALTALQYGCPVKVLGMAIYDIKGLTHEGDLDSFWGNPQKPDPNLRDAFMRLLASSIQVRGNFYTKGGRKRAISEIVEKIENGSVNKPDAFIDPPPRLEKAQSLGVPFT